MPIRALAVMFLVSTLAMLTGAPGLAAPATPTKSVAVFPLEQKTGVTQESAELLTDVVVQALRDASVFSRVMSAKEIETVLAFNVTKEMASCGNSSCLAEIAGQLGVDYIVAGNLGRLGRAHGGEFRRYTIPGRSECAGLTASDTLGAFDWTCLELAGNAVAVSTGLKATKRLSGLVDFTNGR